MERKRGSLTRLSIKLVMAFVMILSVIPAMPPVQVQAAGPFEVRTVADLLKVGTGVDGWTMDADYILMNDIDVSSASWTSIGGFSISGGFTGIFDGKSHVIIGLWGSQGIFNSISAGGVVKNLGLVNISITGGINIGGVTGTNRGAIEYCYVAGSISGNERVGGLTGVNEGAIMNCYSLGSVSGNINIGGIVGYNLGNVEKSYSTSTISGSSHTGGLIGFNFSNGIIRNCVALNLSIIRTTGTENTIGRITGENWIGVNGGIINNCHARNVPNIGGWSVTGIASNEKDGWNTFDGFGYMHTFQVWWATTLNFDFADVWQWCDTEELPILQGLPCPFCNDCSPISGTAAVIDFNFDFNLWEQPYKREDPLWDEDLIDDEDEIDDDEFDETASDDDLDDAVFDDLDEDEFAEMMYFINAGMI
jgi:hypothetical protein